MGGIVRQFLAYLQHPSGKLAFWVFAGIDFIGLSGTPVLAWLGIPHLAELGVSPAAYGVIAALGLIAANFQVYRDLQARIPKDPISTAASWLNLADPATQRKALDALAQIDDERAQDALAQAVSHDMSGVRIGAGLVLARRQDLRGVSGLIEGMNDSDTFGAALTAIDSLAGGDGWRTLWSGNVEATSTIQPQLGAATPQVMSKLATVLGHSGMDADVRRAAARTLVRIGSPAVPYLVEALGRGWGRTVNRAAAAGLGLIDQATPSLIHALRSDDPNRRYYAALALTPSHFLKADWRKIGRFWMNWPDLTLLPGSSTRCERPWQKLNGTWKKPRLIWLPSTPSMGRTPRSRETAGDVAMCRLHSLLHKLCSASFRTADRVMLRATDG